MAAGLTLLALSPALAQPTITNLGTLPGGQESYGFALSADGSVAVGWSGSSSGDRGYRWTAATGMQSIGVLPGKQFSYGYAVSADGSTVVGQCGPSPSAAVRWTASTGMQSLGLFSGGWFSTAFGASADGTQVFGSCVMFPSGLVRPFSWTAATGLVQLPALPAATTCDVNAAAPSGSFAVGTSGSASGPRAVRWAFGAVEDLGVAPGWLTSQARGVSADGSTVTGTLLNGSLSQAFRWTAQTGAVPLGTLPGGTQSTGLAISGSGLSIAGTSNSTQGTRVFLWTPELGMVDLASWLTSQGVNMTGWRLSEARGFSADGSALIGTGIFSGRARAWVVRGLPVPAPAVTRCNPADIADTAGNTAPNGDGCVNNGDFGAFVDALFSSSCQGPCTPGAAPCSPADVATTGGTPGPDGCVDNGDVQAFFSAYFSAVCPACP